MVALWMWGKNLKNVSVFRVVFSEKKNAEILNFSWIKYFGNDFLFLKKLPFGCKLVYILGKTVQDIALDRFLRQIASDVLKFLMLFLKLS